jgi:hypothetical protein
MNGIIIDVQTMKRQLCAFALVALVGTSGCLRDQQETTGSFEPTPIFQDSSVIFTGVLSPAGVKTHSFTLDFMADVKVTFASLTTGNTTLSVPATLTMGTPSSDGATCTATAAMTTNVAPSLTTNLAQSLVTGTYCVGIADSGSLSGDATYALRVRKTLAPPSFGQAGTDTFSTNLYPGGKVNRSFGATAGGEVKVEITGVTPQASIAFGIGVTQDEFDDCYLNKLAVTTPGSSAQLTANVEPGVYCVKVFDPGGLPDRVTFDAKITHP